MKKFTDNQSRDARTTKALRGLGFKVLTVWECETKDLTLLAERLESQLPEAGKEIR